VFRLADVRIDRAARPEIGLFAAWAGSQIIIAGSVALTGGPSMPTMAWFAIPLVTLSARFSERGIALGLALTLVLIFAVCFGVDPEGVIADPPLLIAPVAMVFAVAMLQTVLMRSDVAARAEAVIDPLTGMLNRKALDSRVAELRQQSRMTGEPVGLIVADLDHFKSVNDEFGHAVGDAVLSDVAGAIRNALRAFDLVYRLGGEEFLVLLPGADADQTAAIGEQLRAAVAAAPVGGGHSVTISLGVSASDPGTPFDYESLFAAADGALYAAKRDGRDCVRRPADVLIPVPA
jgi:diguanylate cyclase (GGDEF)-like protein